MNGAYGAADLGGDVAHRPPGRPQPDDVAVAAGGVEPPVGPPLSVEAQAPVPGIVRVFNCTILCQLNTDFAGAGWCCGIVGFVDWRRRGDPGSTARVSSYGHYSPAASSAASTSASAM